jgi:hypothetical protein
MFRSDRLCPDLLEISRNCTQILQKVAKRGALPEVAKSMCPPRSLRAVAHQGSFGE